MSNEIGKGAYATVYKGKDKKIEGRYVAMKEFTIPLDNDEGLFVEFYVKTRGLHNSTGSTSDNFISIRLYSQRDSVLKRVFNCSFAIGKISFREKFKAIKHNYFHRHSCKLFERNWFVEEVR